MQHELGGTIKNIRIVDLRGSHYPWAEIKGPGRVSLHIPADGIQTLLEGYGHGPLMSGESLWSSPLELVGNPSLGVGKEVISQESYPKMEGESQWDAASYQVLEEVTYLQRAKQNQKDCLFLQSQRKKEPSQTASGNVIWYSHFEKQHRCSSEN